MCQQLSQSTSHGELCTVSAGMKSRICYFIFRPVSWLNMLSSLNPFLSSVRGLLTLIFQQACRSTSLLWSYDHRQSVTFLCPLHSFSSNTGTTDGRGVYFLDVGSYIHVFWLLYLAGKIKKEVTRKRYFVFVFWKLCHFANNWEKHNLLNEYVDITCNVFFIFIADVHFTVICRWFMMLQFRRKELKPKK
jgi:hypothetical protein